MTYGATTTHKVQTLAQFEALCVVPKVKDKRLAAAKHAIKRAHCSVGKVTKAFSAHVKRARHLSEAASREPTPSRREGAPEGQQATLAPGRKPGCSRTVKIVAAGS